MQVRAALGPLVAVAMALGWPGVARAYDITTIPCGLVEEGTIHIDGLLGDWEGVSPIILKVNPAPGMTTRTLGVRVSCNYDPRYVYLLVDVTDDIIIRSKDAAAGEDHLELGFGVDNKAGEVTRIDKLLIWPGSNPQKQARVVRWEAKSPPKVVQGEGPAGRAGPLKGPPAFEVYEALQPHGYAVELRMPKKVIPGYRDGATLKLAIKVVDGDGPGAGPGKLSYAETSPIDRAAGMSEVEFEEGQSGYGDLLKDLKVQSSDVYFEKNADIGEGLGKVLMAGRFLAFAGKSYAYLEMAQSRADIVDVQLIPLDGQTHAVALRIAEHGGGGHRQVLRVYRLAGGRFESLFATEVQKEQGSRRLSVQVNFSQKGPNKPGEIELIPQPPVGFSEANYGDVPAEDVIPILLPWQDKKTRYVFKAGKFTKQ
jgi:hypothetical protein